jgi:hypothetical protein
MPPVLPPERIAYPRQRLLRCGMSARPMSLVGQIRSSDDVGSASSITCGKSRPFLRPMISRLRRVILPNPLRPPASPPPARPVAAADWHLAVRVTKPRFKRKCSSCAATGAARAFNTSGHIPIPRVAAADPSHNSPTCGFPRCLCPVGWPTL